MIDWGLRRLARHLRVFLILPIAASSVILAQQPPDITTIVRGIDASVKNRLDRLAGYTVTEHYALFRGKEEPLPRKWW